MKYILYLFQLLGFVFNLLTLIVYYDDIPLYSDYFIASSVYTIILFVFLFGRDFEFLKHKSIFVFDLLDLLLLLALVLIGFGFFGEYALIAIFLILRRISQVVLLKSERLVMVQFLQSVLIPCFTLALFVKPVFFWVIVLSSISGLVVLIYPIVNLSFEFNVGTRKIFSFEMYNSVLKQCSTHLPVILVGAIKPEMLSLVKLFQSGEGVFNSFASAAVNKFNSGIINHEKRWVHWIDIYFLWLRAIRERFLPLGYFFIGVAIIGYSDLVFEYDFYADFKEYYMWLLGFSVSSIIFPPMNFPYILVDRQSVSFIVSLISLSSVIFFSYFLIELLLVFSLVYEVVYRLLSFITYKRIAIN